MFGSGRSSLASSSRTTAPAQSDSAIACQSRKWATKVAHSFSDLSSALRPLAHRSRSARGTSLGNAPGHALYFAGRSPIWLRLRLPSAAASEMTCVPLWNARAALHGLGGSWGPGRQLLPWLASPRTRGGSEATVLQVHSPERAEAGFSRSASEGFSRCPPCSSTEVQFHSEQP